MNETDFQQMQILLKQQGRIVNGAEYSPEFFGSWWLSVATTPQLRVIWDGKEGMVVIQEKTDEMYGNSPIWKTLWTSRDPKDQVLSCVLAKFQECCGSR
jgi:hypothetical protein